MNDVLMLYPTIKETIWGGRKLIDEYGFETDGENAAEAWLLSCHKDGPSFVLNGDYKGKTLAEVIDKEGKQLLGTNCKDVHDFPVLIKIIDACDKLSVQVHPGDEYARRVENDNGKTEAWYVLSAEKDAELIYGVNKKMTREDFLQSINDGTLLENVNRVKVKPGDVVFIPSGMLHAIGKGILLAEVQQSSNTTYRVFDYMRTDKNGKQRELHTKKASDVVDLNVPEIDFAPKANAEVFSWGKKQYLTGCEFFSMTLNTIDGSAEFTADSKSFVSLLTLEGSGKLIYNSKEYELKKGSSVFVPAGAGDFIAKGKMTLLETRS